MNPIAVHAPGRGRSKEQVDRSVLVHFKLVDVGVNLGATLGRLDKRPCIHVINRQRPEVGDGNLGWHAQAIGRLANHPVAKPVLVSRSIFLAEARRKVAGIPSELRAVGLIETNHPTRDIGRVWSLLRHAWEQLDIFPARAGIKFLLYARGYGARRKRLVDHHQSTDLLGVDQKLLSLRIRCKWPTSLNTNR